MLRPIAISLTPNTEKDDVVLALRLLFTPGRWQDEEAIAQLEEKFSSFFPKGFRVKAVNSGRSAEYVALKALGIGKGDEVAIQAFTCVAVPNSVIWTGAKPVFIDTDETYNLSADDLAKKITKRTKAVIVQHTFGVPANLDRVKEVADRHGLYLIEDCSHSLGAKFKGKITGSLGVVSFFSFGRDKVVSSVFGGAILTKDGKLFEKLLKEIQKLAKPETGWIVQQLLHPPLLSLILPFYKYFVGKLALFGLQKLHLLSKAVYEEEKRGRQNKHFPRKMAGALSLLALNQLKKLEKYNRKRKWAARYYLKELKGLGADVKLPRLREGAIWLRFPIEVSDQASLFRFAKKRGVLLGDWYKGLVDPSATEAVGYTKGSCPAAESQAKRIINLPTYPALNQKQAQEVVEMIEKWLNTKRKK